MINNYELIDKIKSYNKFLNYNTLNKAFKFAIDAHKNQKRDEGVPYIIHPVAVANILTDLKLDSATITTGLLHDTIEDTKVTYETVKKEFGEEVANLVEGVTKISALEDKASEDSKAENFRKLIIATSKDIRVLLVKLADRLHNMRTIKFVRDKDKSLTPASTPNSVVNPSVSISYSVSDTTAISTLLIIVSIGSAAGASSSAATATVDNPKPSTAVSAMIVFFIY